MRHRQPITKETVLDLIRAWAERTSIRHVSSTMGVANSTLANLLNSNKRVTPTQGTLSELRDRYKAAKAKGVVLSGAKP